MEENGQLVQFIFNTDREVIAEKENEWTIYIRGSELLASSSDHARTYYHYANDEMGSCTHIVDDRKILNQYEYDAWGNVVNQKETVKNRFKFNGQQLDPITQQYYLRARFYNPVIARFTQEDNYRGDGLNLYSYCANNPIYYVDPSGNACEPAKEILLTRREALNEAKDLAQIPRSAQPTRQWIVGSDKRRKGFNNYTYNQNPSNHGRYYEYDTHNGKRVIVDHNNDIEQGNHTHAGKPKGNPNDKNYDFKENRYSKINKEDGDHHIRYK